MNTVIIVVATLLIIIGITTIQKATQLTAGINAIYWMAFVIVAMIMYDTRNWSCLSLLYIEIVAVFVYLGSFTGSSIRLQFQDKQQCEEMKASGFQESTAIILLIGIITIAFIGQLLALKSYGYSISALMNKNQFIEMNATIAYNRYNGGDVTFSSIVLLLQVFSYIAPLCGGYYFGNTSSLLGKFVSFLSLGPILLGMLITNTKAGFIGSIMLFLVSYLLSLIEQKGKLFDISIKTIILIMLIIVVLFAMLFTTMCVRIGSFTEETINIVKEKFATYAVGHMEAFEVWFNSWLTSNFDYELGANTFLSLANQMGLKTKTQGIYELIEGADSNVFTAYRGVITDYGLVGSFVFYYMLGFVSKLLERYIYEKEYTPMATAVLGSIVFFVLYSFIISPWVYTSFVIAFVVFGIFIACSTYRIVYRKEKLYEE